MQLYRNDIDQYWIILIICHVISCSPVADRDYSATQGASIWFVYHLFIICSSFVHHLFIICSYLSFTICNYLFHKKSSLWTFRRKKKRLWTSQAPCLDAQLCSHAVRAARVSASLPSRGAALGTALCTAWYAQVMMFHHFPWFLDESHVKFMEVPCRTGGLSFVCVYGCSGHTMGIPGRSIPILWVSRRELFYTIQAAHAVLEFCKVVICLRPPGGYASGSGFFRHLAWWYKLRMTCMFDWCPTDGADTCR